MNDKSPPSKLFHNQNQNLYQIDYSSAEHSIKKCDEHQTHSKQRKLNLTRSIGSFEIAKQINHRTCETQFKDYICIKNQSYPNRKDKIQHSSSKKDDQNIQQSFYYLAKVFGNQKLTRQTQQMHINLMKQFLSLKEKIVDQEGLKHLIVLSPDQLNSRIRQSDQVYVQISLQKHFGSVQECSFICLNSLQGLRDQEKLSSELYCLNLFYLFSLKVINPLVFLAQRILTERKCKLQSLLAFLSLILVKQNIVYDKKSQQFFLFFLFRCTSNRSIHSTGKVNSSLQSLEQQQQLVQRKILQTASQIFWNSFGHITKCELSLEYASCLHSNFLSNFLFSIWKGEVSLSQSIEILQSKQKRKSFINSKIKITDQASHQKSPYKSHLNPDSEMDKTCSFPSSQIAEFGIYHIKIKSKRKSVHRRLSDKRSTIDTIIQEGNPQRDIPPSFQSRSHQKKGRLFRHDAKRQSRSRQKKSLTFLYKSDDAKHMTVNSEIRYESFKRQSQSGQRKMGSINPLDNFSFMKSSGRDKQTLEKGTLTVEGNQRKQQQSHKKVNNILKEGLNSKARFSKGQIQGKHSLAKKSQTTSSNNKHMSSAGLENNTTQSRRSSMMWGSKNRRYLMLNNFLPDGKNETISKLIQNQKEILNLRNTSKSQQRQLLNRSQEKALELFSKEITVLSNQNEQQLQSGSKARTIDIYQSKKFVPQSQSRYSRTHDTNDQFKSLLKNIKNNKQQNYRYGQTNNFDGKDHNKTIDPRNFGVHSKQFVEKYFSPPKNKKSSKKHDKTEQNSFDQSKTMHIERISNEERKVDDKMFRSKFYSLLAKSSSNKQRKQQCRIVGVDADDKEKNVLANDKVNRDENERLKELCNLATENNNSLPEAQLVLPAKCKSVDSNGNNYQTNQIGNEYLLDDQQRFENNSKDCRVVDRSQKSLISAAKKLNNKMENKNFNMEDVFVEQQILSKYQEKQRMLSKGMPQPEKSNKYETIQTIKQSFGQNQRAQFDDDIDLEDEDQPGSDIQNKSKNQSEFHDSHQSDIANKSKIQQKHILSELVELISPIKNAEPRKTQNPEFGKAELRKSQNPEFGKSQNSIQIVDQINYEVNGAMIEKNEEKQQPQEKPKFTFKPKLTPSQDENNQISMKPFGKPSQSLESDELTDINIPTLQKEDNLKAKMFQTQKLDQNQIEEVRTIERKPSISLKKKPSSDNHETKTVSFAEASKQEDKIPPKQAKETKIKNQKNPIRKISVEQQFELEQIKLVPATKKATQNAPKAVESKQKQEESGAASGNIRKASISETNKGPSSHRPPISPGKKQEEPRLEQCQPIGTGKKSSENKREHTGQSSVASSYGPNKTVKKIVDEYIFMVNKIGEAVAKTPKVSKKIEGVTQWYVGVYFLYKRFLYERKKIQKYLKEGTPKLSRYYDEEINLDEWNVYLKSKQRQALLNKVSEENVNISKSIQKMQKKLLGRNIPESIKAHAAISQRSNRESCIAVDAVIDEFDTLVEKGMLQDEEISVHCCEMLNACLIVAELDQLLQEIVPITEYSKMKRTPQQLEDIAQDLYDLYHEE